MIFISNIYKHNIMLVRRRSVFWAFVCIGFAALTIRLLDWNLHKSQRLSRELIDAVTARQVSRVKELLTQGADPNSIWRPKGIPDVVQWKRLFLQLIGRNDDNRGDPVLCIAVRRNPHSRDYVPGHPIAQAELVQLLLDHGANPNLRDIQGNTALIYGLEEGWEIDNRTITLLLSYGADPNAYSKEGQPAINLATYYGFTDAVALLLNYNADPDAADNYGIYPNAGSRSHQTALMIASESGRTKIVQLLLKHRAKVNIRDTYGKTAFDYAYDTYNDQSIFQELHRETRRTLPLIIELLKNAGGIR